MAAAGGLPPTPSAASPEGPPTPENAPRVDPTFKGFDKRPGVDEIPPGLQENVALRGPGTKVFEVPGGGAHLAQIFASPVHFRDATGQWQEIDPSVVRAEGGFRNAAHEFGVFFPDRLGGPSAVQLDHGDSSLSFGIQGAAASRAVASSNRVTYRHIFDNVDLEYATMSDGFKENVILRNDRAKSSITYEIAADGLELLPLEDGRIEIRKGGGSIGFFPPFFAQEAPTEDGLAGSAAYAVASDLTEVSPGRYELTASIDDAWLQDPDRRFPVVLDPTFVTSNCGTCPPGTGIPQLKDMSYSVGNNAYPYENHGTLRIGRDTSCCTLREGMTYMTFDVTQQVRKMGNLIYDAKFDIYNWQSMVMNAAEFELKRITADWNEYQTTGTPPSVDDTKVWSTYDPCTPTSCLYRNNWWRWDVKGIMQYWIDNGVGSNHGWRLSAAPGQWSDMRDMFSKESLATEKPYVFVAVNAMPSTRTFTMDDPNWPYLDLATDALPNGSTVNGIPVTLKIKDLTDTNQDPIVVRYQVSRSQTNFSGEDLVYDTGWMSEVSQYTVPSEVFTSGTYYWRAQASDTCAGTYVDQDDPEAAGEDLCDDLSHETGRARAGRERPTSAVRSFTWNPPSRTNCSWTDGTSTFAETPQDGVRACEIDIVSRASIRLPFAPSDEIAVLTANVLQGTGTENPCPSKGKAATPGTPEYNKAKTCWADRREGAFAARVAALSADVSIQIDDMKVIPDVILLNEVRRDRNNDDDVWQIVAKLNGVIDTPLDANNDNVPDNANFRIAKSRNPGSSWIFNRTGGTPPTTVTKADTAIVYNADTMQRHVSPEDPDLRDQGTYYDATYTAEEQVQGKECRNSAGAEIDLDIDLDGIDECKTRTFKRNYIIALDKLNSDLSVALASVHLVPKDFLDQADKAGEEEARDRSQTDFNNVKKNQWMNDIANMLASRYPNYSPLIPHSVTHRVIGGDFNIERCIPPKYEPDYATRVEQGITEPEERQDCTERNWWLTLSAHGYEDSVFSVHGGSQASLDEQYRDGNVRRDRRIDFVMAQRTDRPVAFTGASHDLTCGLPDNCRILREEERYSDHRLVWARVKQLGL